MADDEFETHNPGVDERLVERGVCGHVHLATGRTCTLSRRHRGPCDFVEPAQVAATLAASSIGIKSPS